MCGPVCVKKLRALYYEVEIWSKDYHYDTRWLCSSNNYRLSLFWMLKSFRLQRPELEGVFARLSYRGFTRSKFLQAYHYLWLYFNLPLLTLFEQKIPQMCRRNSMNSWLTSRINSSHNDSFEEPDCAPQREIKAFLILSPVKSKCAVRCDSDKKRFWNNTRWLTIYRLMRWR